MGGSVRDWSFSRLLPLSCKSFQRLSFCLSSPPSVSSLIPVDLSLQVLWCCQTRPPPWPPGPSIIEPWAGQQLVCVRNPVVYFRYENWQPDLIRLFCWIKTYFSCCCDHGFRFSTYCVLCCGIKFFLRVVLIQRVAGPGGHMTHLFACIGRASAPFTCFCTTCLWFKSSLLKCHFILGFIWHPHTNLKNSVKVDRQILLSQWTAVGFYCHYNTILHEGYSLPCAHSLVLSKALPSPCWVLSWPGPA